MRVSRVHEPFHPLIAVGKQDRGVRITSDLSKLKTSVPFSTPLSLHPYCNPKCETRMLNILPLWMQMKLSEEEKHLTFHYAVRMISILQRTNRLRNYWQRLLFAWGPGSTRCQELLQSGR